MIGIIIIVTVARTIIIAILIVINSYVILFSLSNSNYFTSAKKCQCESCIMDFLMG